MSGSVSIELPLPRISVNINTIITVRQLIDSMLMSKLFAIVHRAHSPTVAYWMEMAFH